MDDIQDDIINQSSEDEGEDLIDGMERDYQANDELDRYENVGIDNEDH